MWLSYILGLNGPNGKYFCNNCLVSQQDVAKGIPHSPVILPKYRATDSNEGERFEIRSLESIKENAKLFQENGAKNPSDYFNCENSPLIDLNGPVIGHISVAPLYISLGLGLKNVDVAEQLAIAEDKKIKEENGITSENMLQLLHDRDSCCTQIANLENQQNDLKSSLLATENSLEILKNNNGFAFEKLNGKLKDKSKNAILIRKHGNELKKRVDKFEKDLKENEKQQKEKKLTLAEHLANIDKCKGPFKAEFDRVTDSFKLEQTVYHSGALVGNDVNKLTKTANIKKLCNVFKP